MRLKKGTRKKSEERERDEGIGGERDNEKEVRRKGIRREMRKGLLKKMGNSC